jgi:mannose-1-phosphate guanylyltransferase
MKFDHTYLVILAGGSGTRLWPFSRKNLPKQFLKIGSSDSLVRETVLRLLPLVSWDRVWIVCGKDHGELMKQEFPELSPNQLLLEPCGRNTAAAIAWAAHTLKQIDPEAVLVVLPADHKIPSEELSAFQTIISQAIQFAAKTGSLLTLGVKPTYPATGYGYVQRGARVENESSPVFRVSRFQEKPDLETAQRYLKSGDYFWNSGMFVWQAEAYLQAYQKFLPQDAAFIGNTDFYPQLSSISVDYAILEKSDSVTMMEASFQWDDVGSLVSLLRYYQKDSDENARFGNTLAMDSRHNLILSDEGVVACLGIENLVVIRNKDAVLVIPQDRVQEVKLLLEELKKKGYDRYL